MTQYKVIAKTGKHVNYIRLRADDISSAIDKAFQIWRESKVLTEAEIHFTQVKCEEV